MRKVLSQVPSSEVDRVLKAAFPDAVKEEPKQDLDELLARLRKVKPTRDLMEVIREIRDEDHLKA